MKMRTFFILLSIASFLTSSAQDNYLKQWRRIDSLLQQEGLSETAGKEVEAILKTARSTNNQAQVIKALQYKMSIDMLKRENALEASIARFEAELKTAKQPGRSVIQSLLAETYWNYLQQNRYRLYDLSNIPSGERDELTSLSLEQLTGKIRQFFLQSISQADQLQHTPVSKFDAIIEKGNARKYRPTLFDLLAFRALEYFRNDEASVSRPATAFRIDDKRYFDPAQLFAGLSLKPVDSSSNAFFALKIYQQLLSFHKADEDASAYIDADINRISFVYQQSNLPEKDSLYTSALKHIYTTSSNQPAADQAAYQLAEYYAQLASGYDPVTDTSNRTAYTIALELAEKIIAANRKS
ncbi:MAG TPA: hypothetical protein VLC28_13955, partial [Flavitalea sp.]|nr:hypothetical protein [Flavitalea sp.]